MYCKVITFLTPMTKGNLGKKKRKKKKENKMVWVSNYMQNFGSIYRNIVKII